MEEQPINPALDPIPNPAPDPIPNPAAEPLPPTSAPRRQIIAELISWMRRHQLTYDETRSHFRAARLKIGMKVSTNVKRRLPKILSDAQIDTMMQQVERLQDRDALLIRIMFYCGLRVSEACKLRHEDFDLDKCELRINDGKGGKDAVIPFPAYMVREIRNYIARRKLEDPRSPWMFSSAKSKGPITRGRAYQIIALLGKTCAIPNLHPHRLRHTMITWLTRRGLSDAQLMAISRHADPKTLKIYQDLTTKDVQTPYQSAIRKLEGAE